MRGATRKVLGAALAVAAVAGGCGADRAGPAAGGGAAIDATGPRALLARWQRALVEGDKTAYLACFTGSPEDLVLALAVFEGVQAGYAFHAAVVSAYGAAAWQVFETSERARVYLFPREPRWLRTITVVRTGGLALAYLPRGRVPLHLVEQGGHWRIHAASLAPPGFEATRAAQYLFKWAAALRGLVPQVTGHQLAAEKATEDFAKDFRARLAPEEQPAAAAAVDAFLAQ